MPYFVDRWVILKITPKDSPSNFHYRLYHGNYGGYAGSDTWNMNSGITKVEKLSSHIVVHGVSGSRYECHLNCEGTSSYMRDMLAYFKSTSKELDLEEIPFKEIDWPEGVLEERV